METGVSATQDHHWTWATRDKWRQRLRIENLQFRKTRLEISHQIQKENTASALLSEKILHKSFPTGLGCIVSDHLLFSTPGIRRPLDLSTRRVGRKRAVDIDNAAKVLSVSKLGDARTLWGCFWVFKAPGHLFHGSCGTGEYCRVFCLLWWSWPYEPIGSLSSFCQRLTAWW